MTVKFIAEIGSNHNQDIDRAAALIRASKEAGCWGVKFQWYRAEEMYSPPDMPEGFKKTELREDWIPTLAMICRDNGVAFGVTPFSLDMPGKLAPSCDFLKIASYEILRSDLIRDSMTACRDHGKPLMVSTGMASLDEVMNVLNIARSVDFRDLVLYHCTAKYPAKDSECELDTIRLFAETLRSAWRARSGDTADRIAAVGWSDHSRNPGVVHRAACNGVDYIEFHIDLEDRAGWESRHGHCWDPDTIKTVIRDIRSGEIAITRTAGHMYIDDDRLMRADPSDGMRPHKERRLK